KKAATKFYFSLNTTGECSAKFDDENGVVVFSPIVSMRRFNGERDTDVDIHEKLVAAGCTYDEKTGLCTITFENYNNSNLTIYRLNDAYGVSEANVYSVPNGAELVLNIAINDVGFYFYGGAAAIWTECYNNSKINKVATNAAKNVGNQVITQFSRQYQRFWILGQKKITLLHFSDIHGDEKNFKRIVQYVEENKSMLTDVICTGDIVNYQFSDGIDWWKNNIGDNKILMAIGNHDPLVTQGTWDWFGKNAAECYDRYFSSFIAKWGVNYTQDLCYYCKDYSDVSIRLIVLDGMRWNNIKEDTVQEEWFKQQLNDAKEKNLHVVVASHFPPDTSVGNKNNNINFDCWYSTQQWEKESYGLLSPKVADAINDFQTSGGKFICYIGGHTHGDLFRPLKRYPNQLMVIVANASCYEHVNNADCWYSRHESDNSQELFNLLNIDTENKILSIVRVGCCFDRYARHIGTISFDYENHKVLSQY
ncbi:metallophosphoesterase, partial [Leyella stercorea]|uniref:metallophosphoesterase family protein n=1 Tax=Leyella stercorea TaxID=363265 RepID=UPI00242E37C8